MAWYCKQEVRFRGRLVEVELRYLGWNSAKVVKGWPMTFNDPFYKGEEGRLARRLMKLVNRAHRDCRGPGSRD